VFRAGVVDAVGATPFAFKVKRGEPDFDVLLKNDGYKDETRTIATDREHAIMVSLAKIAAPPPPVAPTPVAPSATPRPKHRGGSPTAATHGSPTGEKKKADKPGAGGKHVDPDEVLSPSF
jgi:hypothetical protein